MMAPLDGNASRTPRNTVGFRSRGFAITSLLPPRAKWMTIEVDSEIGCESMMVIEACCAFFLFAIFGLGPANKVEVDE